MHQRRPSEHGERRRLSRAFHGGLLAGIVLAIVGGSMVTAHAAPRVTVKARTLIEGLQVAPRAAGVAVSGLLRDDLGLPVPGASVVVERDAREAGGVVVRDAVTDETGRFTALFPASAGADATRSMFRVRYSGSTLLGPVEEARESDSRRSTAHLSVRVAEEMPATLGGEGVALLLSADRLPIAGATLDVYLDGAAGPVVRTDATGRARLVIPPGPPGRTTIRVGWSGDVEHDATQTERVVERAVPLEITLRAERPAPISGEPLVLEGEVVTGPREIEVVLLAGCAPIAMTRSDATGRFGFRIGSTELPPGPAALRAAGSTTTPGWQDALSGEVLATIPPRPAASKWWGRTAVLAAAFAALVALGMAWRRRPRVRSAEGQPARPPPPPPVELVRAPRRRGAARADLQIEARDALSRAPLPALVVVVDDPATEAPLFALTPPEGTPHQCDEEGRQRLTLEEDATLWVGAEGYVSVHAQAGASGGHLIVHLMPVRAHVQQMYDEVLHGAGPPPLAFGRQTPREAAPALDLRGAPVDAVNGLTPVVEGACFGPLPPTETELTAAHQAADRVRRGLRHVSGAL